MLRISAQQASAWGSRSITASSDSCTARAAGKIQDQRLSPHAADPPAERRQRSLLCTLKAHAFGNAFEQAVANFARGFRSDVALGDAGATGCDTRRTLAASRMIASWMAG